MNERQRRIGENEAVFRSVNEQIRNVTATLANATESMKLVCECGTRSCTDQFEVTATAYAEVRLDPTLFFIKPGHDFPEAETVVGKEASYWIVRKDAGGPAALARLTE